METKKTVTISLDIEKDTEHKFIQNEQLVITQIGTNNYEALGMLQHAIDMLKQNIHYQQYKEVL